MNTKTIDSTNTIKPSDLAIALRVCAENKQPVMIWGAPGVGKSQVVAQCAALLNMKVVDVRVAQMDAVDLRGIPDKGADGRTVWLTPDFLPRVDRDGEHGILFLDEITSAPPSVSAAAYQLVLDRKLGDYTLPDGWVVFAAGNRETDRAVVNRMPTALANRFVHLHTAPNIDDWCVWALSSNIAAEVIAFLRFRPELLHQFDPSSNAKAFASPRSWEFVGRKIIGTDMPAMIERALIAGAVGEGAAAEFSGFLQVWRHLPDPDQVLLTPDQAPVPTDPATLYAICGALSMRATPHNMPSVVAYANRLPDEYSVLLMRDCMTRDKETVKTRAFTEWAAKHQHVML